jgi:RNA recognition motif-containing protein
MNQGRGDCTSGDPELKTLKMPPLTADLKGKSQYMSNNFEDLVKHEITSSSAGNGLPLEERSEHVTGDNCSSGCWETGVPEESWGCNAEIRGQEESKKAILTSMASQTTDSRISDVRPGTDFENARDLSTTLPNHGSNGNHIECSRANARSDTLQSYIGDARSPVQGIDLSVMSLNNSTATGGAMARPELGSLPFFSPEGTRVSSDQKFFSKPDLSMIANRLDEELEKNDSLDGMPNEEGQLQASELSATTVPQQIVPQTDKHLLPSANDSGPASGQNEAPTRYLWVGNLTISATRAVLQTIFERFGALEDLISFPTRMYAFVTYQSTDSAVKAVESIQGIIIKDVTGEKGMILKFRPEKKVMSFLVDGISKDGSSCRASSTGEYEVEPSPRIWLGNIAPTATAANLQAVLGRFGPLVDAAVFPARIGPLGYAFVKFEKIEDAINAFNTLNNAVVPALSGTKQVKMRYKPVSEGMPVRDAALDALQGTSLA